MTPFAVAQRLIRGRDTTTSDPAFIAAYLAAEAARTTTGDPLTLSPDPWDRAFAGIAHTNRALAGAARAAGVVLAEAMTRILGIDQRFWAKVNGGDYSECWLWTARIDQQGYGRFSVGGRAGGMAMAHRVAYELMRAPIPEGLQVDHLCRNRACVNPWHLEPVTALVNSQRSSAGEVNGARQLAVTHCPQGHPYDKANTRIRRSGARSCRACEREAFRRRYAADPEKHRAIARASRARRTV